MSAQLVSKYLNMIYLPALPYDMKANLSILISITINVNPLSNGVKVRF